MKLWHWDLKPVLKFEFLKCSVFLYLMLRKRGRTNYNTDNRKMFHLLLFLYYFYFQFMFTLRYRPKSQIVMFRRKTTWIKLMKGKALGRIACTRKQCFIEWKIKRQFLLQIYSVWSARWQLLGSEYPGLN